MNERIREFLVSENKSSAQLADEIGVQPSGISHILSGRNNPSLDFILKMLEKYQFLSTEWLLFGKGTMYKEPNTPTLFGERDNIIENVKSNDTQKELQREVSDTKPLLNKNYSNIPVESAGKDTSKVIKIVWFYNDNSFEEYYPNN